STSARRLPGTGRLNETTTGEPTPTTAPSPGLISAVMCLRESVVRNDTVSRLVCRSRSLTTTWATYRVLGARCWALSHSVPSAESTPSTGRPAPTTTTLCTAPPLTARVMARHQGSRPFTSPATVTTGAPAIEPAPCDPPAA